MGFECSPSFIGYTFFITFTKAYLVFTFFVNNAVRKVDILLISVRTESCGSDISQFLKVVETSIDFCINIKSHLFDHILTLDKNLMCNFTIGIKEMLEDDVGGLLGGFGIMITQGRNLLCINGSNDFLL